MPFPLAAFLALIGFVGMLCSVMFILPFQRIVKVVIGTAVVILLIIGVWDQSVEKFKQWAAPTALVNSGDPPNTPQPVRALPQAPPVALAQENQKIVAAKAVPYLEIRGAAFDTEFSKPQSIGAIITTDRLAVDVSGQSRVVIQSSEPADFSYGPDNEGPSPLYPTNERVASAVVPAFPAEQVELIKNGTLNVYQYGKITYVDPRNGNRHEQGYCFVYKINPDTSLLWSACKAHNYAR